MPYYNNHFSFSPSPVHWKSIVSKFFLSSSHNVRVKYSGLDLTFFRMRGSTSSRQNVRLDSQFPGIEAEELHQRWLTFLWSAHTDKLQSDPDLSVGVDNIAWGLLSDCITQISPNPSRSSRPIPPDWAGLLS